MIFWSLLGGVLIGLSAAVMLLVCGRIAGISGILGGALPVGGGDRGWRLWFLGGLLAGGALMALARPASFAVHMDRSAVAIAAAGLLVGVGTRLANGCTSGHGVCGVGRLSPRSVAATGAFMATGVITAVVLGRLA
jgi:uncharacterized membrane protein YedE/YeeE